MESEDKLKLQDFSAWSIDYEDLYNLIHEEQTEIDNAQDKLLDEYYELSIEILKILSAENQNGSINKQYDKFIENVKYFYEISVIGKLEELEKNSIKSNSTLKILNLIDSAEKLRQNNFKDYSELKATYGPVIEKVNKLNNQVVSERKENKFLALFELKNQLLIGAILVIMSGIVGNLV
jgi:hypothetical protein